MPKGITGSVRGWNDAFGLVGTAAPYIYQAYKRYKSSGVGSRRGRIPLRRGGVKRRRAQPRGNKKRKKIEGRTSDAQNKAQKSKPLESRVADLEKKSSAAMSIKSNAVLATYQGTSSLNDVTNYIIDVSDTTTIESEALANMKFFDPAVPGTLVTATGATGSYVRDFHVESKLTVVISNNSTTPFWIAVYKCTPKMDSSVTAADAFSDGIADGTNTTGISALVSPMDAPHFTDLYNVTSVGKRRLVSGQSKTYRFPWAKFSYDPSVVDTIPDIYQKMNKYRAFLFRQHGDYAHGTALSTSIGYTPSGSDVTYIREYCVTYDSGGPAVQYKYCTDSRVTAATYEIGTKPASAQTSYAL